MIKTKKTPDKRDRVQIRFDLDIGKIGEKILSEQIEHLKRARKFADFARNGLRLMIDLSAGRTQVLEELFPWVREQLGGQVAQVVPAQADGVDKAWFKKEMALFHKSLLEQFAAGQGNQSNPRPLTVPAFGMPQFDEDDGASQLIVSHKSDGSSAYNFVKNVSSLIQ